MVSSFTFASVATAAAVAVLAGSADAHQTIYIPAPTFTTTDKTTKSNPIAFLENQGVKTSEDLTSYLKSKNAKTLRDFMDNKANYKNEAAGATFECGYTDPNGARQAIPSNGMMRSSGYTHDGPCEVWLDSTRVLGSSTGNCHKDIGGTSVSYKIDWSACKNDCMLRWYWMGKRLIGKKWSWQVYKECVPMKGSGAARSIEDDDAEAMRSPGETDDEDGTIGYDDDEEYASRSAANTTTTTTRCGVKK